MLPDWHQFHADEHVTPAVVDSRRRLRICLGGFVVLLVVVFVRALQLEAMHAAEYRAEAVRPIERKKALPGVRGRILAHDGTVLAGNREVLNLAVHYRYLQQPPDPQWLRYTARSRLTKTQRKDPVRVAAEEARVRQQRDELARRLATLCNVPTDRWQERVRRVQHRVERIAESVNRRRQAEPVEPAPPPKSLAERIGRLLKDGLATPPDDLPPEPIVVAEQRDYHVMIEDVNKAVVARIEGDAEQYPVVKVVVRTRRAYRGGSSAAHLLGHLGRVAEEELDGNEGYREEDLVGRTGLERQYEPLLRGSRGVLIELTDHSGRILSSYRRREPGVGRDLALTVNAQLQRTAETLLDAAMQRRAVHAERAEPAGGAIVVIDVRTGAIRTAASAPRFDPALFVTGDASGLAAVFADPAKPLFDRTVRMAIPPGSVFKTISAVALLEARAIDPQEPFHCQGYLHKPDRQRCAIFRRRGVGHGDVTLADALAVSCNVYFFHHVGELGPGPLTEWAGRFGFGRPNGIDLPGEAAGNLPTPETSSTAGRDWRPGDTQSLAIGQGALTATPLQIARMMAAVASGGKLVTPHLVARLGLPLSPEDRSDDPIDIPRPQPIPGLDAKTLATVRDGLERVVADPLGTAHGTVRIEEVAVAGKTGTAQTGAGRAAHAWFAGYAPADEPKLAFVIALEHAGDAAVAAGPVAKRLVSKMQQLEMFQHKAATGGRDQ